jgi:hypothetical protein
MIVPQYWAEGRAQGRQGERRFTARRFGWSDESALAAQAHADERARAALARWLAGETVARREPKLPYNGAFGLPIREEIVARAEPGMVITRNAYGALCLNTPDVLFADIDVDDAPPMRWGWFVFGLIVLATAAAAWLLRSRWVYVLILVGALFSGTIARFSYGAWNRARGGAVERARRRVHDFVARHPGWGLRLYRTPAGWRALATHRRFDAADPEVQQHLKDLGSDRLYMRMCLNQRCFRARVSGKPWRMGIVDHLRPRPGVWPVAPGKRALREAWVTRYEQTAERFAACAFVETIGNPTVDARVQPVIDEHDRRCKAHSGLALA